MPEKVCPNCGSEFIARKERKYCGSECYQADRETRPIIERIESKISTTLTGCWLWAGSVDENGYGRIRNDEPGGTTYVHRIVWERENGPVPRGLELDHLCRNPSCVNPEHLEAVTHQENVRRGQASNRPSKCKRGHPFDAANTGHRRDGRRYCKTCNQRHKEAA